MSDTIEGQILIVDDAADNRQILSDMLKSDYTVLLAKSGQQALERAQSQPPDLILLDVLMSDMSGYEVMHQLKSDPRTSSIPVILITKLDTPEDEVRGLQLGAVDYITKPFNFTIVKARVKTQMRLQIQRRQLVDLAHMDALTGISNRRQFDQQLASEWSRALRSRLPLSLAMMDADCFKAYNDHFGHAQGDQALQAIAGVLAQALRRPGDLAARYGGEEFVLLMPTTDSAGAWQRAEDIRREIVELKLPHPASTVSPVVSVSIGIATMTADAHLSAAELLAQADAMLYAAKHAGRNRVCKA